MIQACFGANQKFKFPKLVTFITENTVNGLSKYIRLISNIAVCGLTLNLLHGIPAYGQHKYVVTHFDAGLYNGGNQNWSLATDSIGRKFAANNEGLLVIDGAGPELHPYPGNTILRSVAVHADKVYTGSFEAFGYWWQSSSGKWQYVALEHLVGKENLRNEEIWRIVPFGEKIYFQSFGNIFVYNGQTVRKLDLPGNILFLFDVGKRLLVQLIGGAIHELVDENLRPLPGTGIFANTEVKTILPFGENELLIGTSSRGLFLLGKDGRITKWQNEADEKLMTFNLNNGIRLGDNFAFGTILRGILVIDKTGKLLHHIHTGNGMQNNTVLSLEADRRGNLWAGLDRGIDYIWLNAPVEIYRDKDLETGSVYAAAEFQERLYIGTNQGIYIYEKGRDGFFSRNGFVEGSQGQVWFLKVLDGYLYCGLNTGTFVYDGEQLIRLSNINGGYDMKRIVFDGRERMIQPTYNELLEYSFQSGIWKVENVLGGWNAPVRCIEVDQLGRLLLGHAVSGLYLAEPSTGLDSIVHFKPMDSSYGLFHPANQVFNIEGRIVVPSANGFYQWDALRSKFVLLEEINRQLGSFATSSKVVYIGRYHYWFFKPSEIALFEIRFGSAIMRYRLILSQFGLRPVKNYEHVVALDAHRHLLCHEDGFAIIRIPKDETTLSNPRLKLTALFSSRGDTLKRFEVSGESKNRLSLSYALNTVSFRFAEEGEVDPARMFQWKLEGIDRDWNGWSTKTKTEYSRLPYGNYTLRVRTHDNAGFFSNEVELHFRIRPPWYLSWYAYMFYAMLIVAFGVLLQSNRRRRQLKLQERALREENERIRARNQQAEAELIRLNNERLKGEVVSKTMELAKNTMAMIRKNELLIDIRQELANQKEQLGQRYPDKFYNRLIKLIEDGLNSEHDWEMFEHLFDQAHENFFKRLKESYPDLTASDFRLCAYLRMNLSSKEIAPLLNISVRGVEEKRYRLRKKLNLKPDQNLTEFIIGF